VYMHVLAYSDLEYKGTVINKLLRPEFEFLEVIPWEFLPEPGFNEARAYP
jgi:hypothetical protein